MEGCASDAWAAAAAGNWFRVYPLLGCVLLVREGQLRDESRGAGGAVRLLSDTGFRGFVDDAGGLPRRGRADEPASVVRKGARGQASA